MKDDDHEMESIKSFDMEIENTKTNSFDNISSNICNGTETIFPTNFNKNSNSKLAQLSPMNIDNKNEKTNFERHSPGVLVLPKALP